MAYDGPNKAASEARDRVIAKTKAKRAKLKKEDWRADLGLEIVEHHQKDEDGNVIEHEDEADGTPASVEEGKKGLYANIHAKRARGESPAKPGDKDYPAKDAFKKAAKTAKKEEVEVETESMAQARKNVGASTCWTGYKAKGTKMKGGKKVPNCVKEFSEWRKISEKK